MKFLATVFAFLFATATFAQLNGDGYYRVKNFYTNRYIYLVDNRGSVDITSGSADLGSIVPWLGYDKALSDPATVIYIKKITDGYDLMAQGVTSYGIISYPIKIMEARGGNGTYWCYASKAGMSVYLADHTTTNLSKPQGNVTTESLSFSPADALQWCILPLNAETDNYFGLKPTIEVNGKYYKTLYVGFPVKLKSAGMKAYKIVKHSNAYAAMEEITDAVIPAATPVIVECSSAEPANNKIEFVTGNYAAFTSNMLKGVYFRNGENYDDDFIHKNVTAYDAKTMRVLGKTADGKLGFVTSTDKFIDANTAYLALKAEANAELAVVTPEEYKALVPDDLTEEEKLENAKVALETEKAENTSLQTQIATTYGALASFYANAISAITYDAGNLASVNAAIAQYEKLMADYNRYFNDAKTLTVKIKDMTAVAETTNYSGKAAFLAAIADAKAVEQAGNTRAATVDGPEAYGEACKTLDQAYAAYLATGDEDARQLAEAVTAMHAAEDECEELIDQISESYGALAGFLIKAVDAIKVDDADIASVKAATELYKQYLVQYKEYLAQAESLTETIAQMRHYAEQTQYPGLPAFLDAINAADDIATAYANSSLVKSPEAYKEAVEKLAEARETYDKTEGDGINAVIADTKSGAVYTLFGTKVRNGLSVEGLPAGIYVVNGKKVLVK